MKRPKQKKKKPLLKDEINDEFALELAVPVFQCQKTSDLRREHIIISDVERHVINKNNQLCMQFSWCMSHEK